MWEGPVPFWLSPLLASALVQLMPSLEICHNQEVIVSLIELPLLRRETHCVSD